MKRSDAAESHLHKNLEQFAFCPDGQPMCIIYYKNFDILAINETRLDCTISDDLVNVPNYDVIRFDRNRNGGGVCIYLNNAISYCNLSHKVPGNLEAV
jgi:hypothetical protein